MLLKFLSSAFKNEYFTSNLLLLLTFIFLSSLAHEIQICVLFDPILGLKASPTGAKTVIFCKNDLRNKLIPSKFHQILISIFLSASIRDIQLCAFCSQFGDNDVTEETNIPEFCNFNQKIGSDLLKMQMTGSVETSIVVLSQYITLKLFSRTLKNDVIKGPLFRTFH